jgi:hypothetical protein
MLLRSPAYASILSIDEKPTMTTRRASCSCGQLHLTIQGEPVRISMCHCLECQRRTGAVLSNQARFPREQITFAGTATAWRRTAESGNTLTFHFCPTCGSTVYWENEGFPGVVAVAIGSLADPNFPAPTIAVWEESRHHWISLPPDTPPSERRSKGNHAAASEAGPDHFYRRPERSRVETVTNCSIPDGRIGHPNKRER